VKELKARKLDAELRKVNLLVTIPSPKDIESTGWKRGQ
jgi:hypothetical protein